MKLFLLPAATLLMANGAYASIRGATTDIVDFIDNGRIDYQCNFADDQKRTCPEEEWTVQDDGSAEAKGPFDCGTDGDTQLGCCTITAPKDVVDAWQTARTRGNDRRENDIGEEVMTFDLPGHGTCTQATGPDDVVFTEVGAQWHCNMPNHSGCPRDRTEYICDDNQTACCDITFSDKEKKMRRTRKGRVNMKNLKQTVPLEGYGSCTLVDTDSSTSSDMFESELSNGIELDEDELYPDFLQLEGKCGCKHTDDCVSGKFCDKSVKCNTKNTNNTGQCKNEKNNKSSRNNKSGNCSNKSKNNCKDSSHCTYHNGKCKSKSSNKSSNSSNCKNKSKSSCKDSSHCKYKNGSCKNKSVDDVLAELIAEEDEKAELSNGIEFVEEERNRCDRSRDCRSGEVCNRDGRCQRNNNYCRKQSDCRNRNDYCDTRRNECRRATGQRCKSGTDCGDGRGSVWMCRDDDDGNGRCEPRSLFELAMELVMHGEGVMFDLDEATEEE